MQEKMLIRFKIKIFNQFGALVEDFIVSEPTKCDAEQYVRRLMRAKKMDEACTFKIL